MLFELGTLGDLGIEALCIGIVCGGIVAGLALVGVCAWQGAIEWLEDRNYGK